MSAATAFQIDPYLAAQFMPANDLTNIDREWHSLDIVTPIGRFANIHVDAPFAIPTKSNRPSPLKYSAQLLMAPGTQDKPIVADIYRAIVAIASSKFPPMQRPDPSNPAQLITVTAEQRLRMDEKVGGLHYPLRSGDDMYMTDPQKFGLWRGLFFINASMWPQTKAGAVKQPVCMDENGSVVTREGKPASTLFYPGCYGRMLVTVKAYSNEGNGVTFDLRGVQFARHGERMATFNTGDFTRNAFEKAGAISGDIGQPPSGWAPGSGPHTATPGSVPPGAAPAGVPYGFAAPPAGAPAGFAAPQPSAQPPGGARPPGV
jgi:hypothetical protein